MTKNLSSLFLVFALGLTACATEQRLHMSKLPEYGGIPFYPAKDPVLAKVDVSEPPEEILDRPVVAHVTGEGCSWNKRSSSSSLLASAMKQIKEKAERYDPVAVINVECRHDPRMNILKNCYSQLLCSGDVVK